MACISTFQAGQTKGRDGILLEDKTVQNRMIRDSK